MTANLISVLLLGLLAGGVSCAAVQGGLLAGLVSRQRSGSNAAARSGIGDDLAPVGGFLAGKLVSRGLQADRPDAASVGSACWVTGCAL